MTNPDWLLGPALRAQREAAGLSIRAAAKAASISEGKWRQLETGYVQAGRGNRIPAGSTPQTVAAAARAVRWSVPEALRLAGYEPDRYRHLDPAETPVDERVPGFAQLTDRQRDAIVGLVAAILAGRHDTPAGAGAAVGLPIRVGEAPADLLDRDDVRIWRDSEGSEPERAVRANGDGA